MFEKHTAVTEPTIQEFKGNKILALPVGEGRDFSFGVARAQAILKYLESIQEFVEKEIGKK
jgi:hypothetical protein